MCYNRIVAGILLALTIVAGLRMLGSDGLPAKSSCLARALP
jgi:hypothetical protein